jgi:hypothetical protein
MKTRRFAGLAPLLLAGALGCGEPPPDTTPGVRILSPVTNQQLPVGKAVEVRFQISGIDPEDKTNKPFRLNATGSTKVPGEGRVAAYFNGTTIQAVTAKDSEPITVPSPPYGSDPKDVVQLGPATISLFLQYNDDLHTPVTPQTYGEVTVNIIP